MDVADAAVLEERGRDEQAVVAGLLDERDDRGQPFGLGRERRQARVVEADRDLGRQVLEQVAGQPELGEHHQAGALGARPAQQLVVDGQVLVELAEPRRDLGKRDPERGHGRSIAGAPAAASRRGCQP